MAQQKDWLSTTLTPMCTRSRILRLFSSCLLFALSSRLSIRFAAALSPFDLIALSPLGYLVRAITGHSLAQFARFTVLLVIQASSTIKPPSTRELNEIRYDRETKIILMFLLLTLL